MTNVWSLLNKAKQLFPIGTHVKIKDPHGMDTGDFHVTGYEPHFQNITALPYSNREFDIAVLCTGLVYVFNGGQMTSMFSYNFEFLERV